VRVSGTGPRDPAGSRAAGRRGFAETLERARRVQDAADRGRARAGVAGRRDAADRAQAALDARRATFRQDSGEGRTRLTGARGPDREVAREITSGPEPGPRAAPSPVAGEPSIPELRAILRALPVAVETARLQDGAPLELAFGRALSVELRAGRAGLEIALRPDASLARAAAAELPALLRALRARGIAIARAEVRGRPPAPRGAR
jgi:hypothetical protein